MKKSYLERRLRRLGWWKAKEGGPRKWTNGELLTMVPRYREINECTAAGILRIASEHRGKR